MTEVINVKKLFYPAIFHKAEEGGFWITFPDIPECMTQGDDMQQAYEMAVDALGLAITSREAEGELSLICLLIRNAQIQKQLKKLLVFRNG